GTAYRLLKDWLVNDVKFSRYWVAPFLFLLFCMLLIQPIQAGHRTGLNEVPSMSDAWWDSLKQIDAEAAPDAIVNSWWDFGHWFKYVADRGVTFDGASQNVPHAHWIGRALITPDEKEALAILRMVDCGNLYGVLDVKEGLPSHDDYESIALTKEIIMLPPEEARSRLLEEGVSPAQAEVVLNHTHCEPPENYFITSADMVGKGGVWGHFGSWDFARADAYQNLRTKPQAEAVAVMTAKYGWTQEEASARYYEMQTLPDQTAVNSWISPWPSYPSSSWAGCGYAANGTAIACPLRIGVGQQGGYNTILDGLLVNLTDINKSALAIGFYDGSGRKVGANEAVKPGKIIIVENGTMTTYNVGTDINQAFIIDLSGSPRVLMADERNAEAMFTRLFFLDGATTTAFEKFSDRNAFNMGRIIVWKVDWTKLEEHGLV
ncbi:hypothetical protein GOV07_00655, partial [Candidatus Woesearchaeota archaeon]|nr:hypothetical protein [Candidatus Woesearchaeota archaeon]